MKNTTDVDRILQIPIAIPILSYKECSIRKLNYFAFALFVLVLGMSASIHQTARCYVVTTSEIYCHVLYIEIQ